MKALHKNSMSARENVIINNMYLPGNCLKPIDVCQNSQSLSEHLTAADPSIVDINCYQWDCGPVSVEMPYLSVLEAKALDKGEYWHYMSSCAGRIEGDGNYKLEFCLQVAEQNSMHVELISMVAYMHRDKSHHLNVGHTVKIGRPFVPGSRLDRLLISLPYPYGSDFEYAHLSNGSHARILWLLPISESEDNFCHSAGLDALEEKFEEQHVDYLDAFRPSVV